MSANIVIQEGNVGKILNGTRRLVIHNSGGGTSVWILEEDVERKSKTINKNGTYYADDEGVYAYSQVTVNVTDGKVTGKKSDGNEYAVDEDGEGNLTETLVPSSIRVTTPPTKTEYDIGDLIDITGIIVTAYKGDGTVYGAVPNNELRINPTAAERDGPISVYWTRPEDDEELETSFNIIAN